MTYRDHIEALAAELDVEVSYYDLTAQHLKSSTFGPNPLTGRIDIGTPAGCDTLQEYTELLHELGHAATLPKPTPLPSQCTEEQILRYEAEAWQWAREHADPELGFDPLHAACGLFSYIGPRTDLWATDDWQYAAGVLRSYGVEADTLAEAFMDEMGRRGWPFDANEKRGLVHIAAAVSLAA